MKQYIKPAAEIVHIAIIDSIALGGPSDTEGDTGMYTKSNAGWDYEDDTDDGW